MVLLHSFHFISSTNGQVHHPGHSGQHSWWILNLFTQNLNFNVPSTNYDHSSLGVLGSISTADSSGHSRCLSGGNDGKSRDKRTEGNRKASPDRKQSLNQKAARCHLSMMGRKNQQNVWSLNHKTKCEALLGCQILRRSCPMLLWTIWGY